MAKTSRILLLTASVLCLLFLAVGCAGHHPRRRPHGTPLSEAMEKASDDHKGSRNIETPDDNRYDDWEQDRPHHDHRPEKQTRPAPSSPQPASRPSPAPPARSDQPGLVSLGVGTGLMKGDDFYQLNHMDLSLGVYTGEKQRAEIYAGLGQALINETSELEDSIDSAWLFTVGLRYKYFTTPRYTFLGHYLTAGLAYNRLNWRYDNEIYVDGDTIRSDSLDGLEAFAGMGIHLAQTDHFQIGVEVLPSIMLWSAYTDEGFDNDIFGPFYMVKFRVTLSFLE